MPKRPAHLRRYWPLYTLGAAAIAVLALARVFFFPSNFDWPAWVQAVGSIAAIIASGMIATMQADRQLSDAHRLQKIERARQALRLAIAVTTVSEKAIERVMLALLRLKWDRETISLIGEGVRGFDRSLLVEVKSDLLSIPLHELPSGDLMHSLMAMQSLTRQLHENVEAALNGYRRMDAEAFENFFMMVDNAHMQMCLHLMDMRGSVSRIEAETVM